VITTRYRRNILKGGVKPYLKLKLVEIRKYYPDIEFLGCSIKPDHIHLFLTFPPKYSPATIVQLIKQNTAKALRDKFEFLRYVCFGRGGIWSVGYFISTVGLNEEMIQQYVRYQEQEDLGQAKLEMK
jgi:putative transposase